MVYHSTRNQKAADRAGRLSAEQFSEQHPGWVSCLPSLRLLFARHCHWLISNTLLGPGEGFATAGRDLQQSTRRQIQDENLLLSADLARYLFDRSILKGSISRWLSNVCEGNTDCIRIQSGSTHTDAARRHEHHHLLLP